MWTSGSVAALWSGGSSCPDVLLDGLWEALIIMGAPMLATIHFMWWNLVAGTVLGTCFWFFVGWTRACRKAAGAASLLARGSSPCSAHHSFQCCQVRRQDLMVLASALEILVICRFVQACLFASSKAFHSTPSRPRPFQESASCSASLAAACLRTRSWTGPSSFRGFLVPKPVQEVAVREDGALAGGRLALPGLHCIHSAHVLGSLASLVVTESQACAASAAAIGHASAASSAEQKANFRSTGLTRPVAVSHDSKGLGAPIHDGKGGRARWCDQA